MVHYQSTIQFMKVIKISIIFVFVMFTSGFLSFPPFSGEAACTSHICVFVQPWFYSLDKKSIYTIYNARMLLSIFLVFSVALKGVGHNIILECGFGCFP